VAVFIYGVAGLAAAVGCGDAGVALHWTTK